jgi:hypothetical protein
VNRLLRIGAFLPLLAVGLLTAGAVAAHGDKDGKPGRVPMPVHHFAEGEKCVEPTEEMRRNHMEKILHQRDRTMHEGIRTRQHSFKNCVNCHADPKTGSVLGKDGFCESCHSYAAVKIDCFSCHTDKREAAASEAPAGSVRALKTNTGGKKP